MAITETPNTPEGSRRRSANTLVVKRSIKRHGHRSSVSLEDQFWDALLEIAGRENTPLPTLIGGIDRGRNQHNLSSAIRVFVLDYFRREGKQRSAAIRPRSETLSVSESAR